MLKFLKKMSGRKSRNVHDGNDIHRNPVQVHKCLFCTKEFKRVGNLQNHLKKVHEVTDIETQDDEIPKFENTENAALVKNPKEKQKRTRITKKTAINGTFQENTNLHLPFECGGVFNVSGLKHIGEKIFRYLSVRNLFECRMVCQSWNYLLKNPMFWIKYKSQDVKTKLQFEKWKWEHDEWLKVVLNLKHYRNFPNNYKRVASRVAPEVLNSDALECEMSLCLSKRIRHIWYDIKNFSPLHIASQYGKANLVEFLILIDDCMNHKNLCYSQKQLKTNHWDFIHTPIELAVSWGHLVIVKILFPEMNEPLKPNFKGWTLIHYASNRLKDKGHVEILEFLREHILTPIGHLQFPNGNSLLKVAVFNQNIVFLDYLYENTDAPNSPLPDGNTLYEYAIIYGFLKSVEYLSKKLENPMVPNRNGLSPLHLAALNGKVDVVKFLLTLTDVPNPTIPNDENQFTGIGQTPIYMAASEGYLDVLKVLCKSLIKASKKDEILTPSAIGWSPFHIAIKCGHLDVVKYLINFVEDPLFSMCGQKMPLKIALDNGKYDVAQFFLKKLEKSTKDPEKQKTIFDSFNKQLK